MQYLDFTNLLQVIDVVGWFVTVLLLILILSELRSMKK